QSATLGLTARDRTPAYVFPANAAERKDPAAFQPDDDLATWAAFRAYAQSPEIRRLRYVGFRLARKEPPSLDIRDVFVPLEVRVRRRGSAVAAELEEAPAIRNPAIRNPAASAPPGAPWERFERQPAAPIRPFREVFAERRSAVVLGDPGAGKTTLLRWLAVMAAAGPDAMVRELGVAERLLPLPVSLGRLTEVRSVGDGIGSVAATLARYFHDRNVGEAEHLKAFLERQLEAGVCLLLLDGLDEVAVEQRAGLRGWLEAFASRYPRNRFVVTSRIVGFGGFVLPDAVEVVVQPLDDGRVKRYVETFHREYRRWETGVDDPVAAAREARVMLDAIAGSARLREVARNPFLVSALALIHRAEGRLP
ncbi:MAG: NACHT domain-containing protein, partial [bacterium]|nr:NACHT domain-containing protein [bacterium]